MPPRHRRSNADPKLSLASIFEASGLDWAETLWPTYLAAQVALHRHEIANDDLQRADAIAAAAEDALVHPEIARGLKALRNAEPERTASDDRPIGIMTPGLAAA